mmetsp:Transcript_753/g.1286  ORF Transcript_753/g.1286 Transcript_753/m.1286 type:complete len:253 (-) Transcript_753:62-820(-)
MWKLILPSLQLIYYADAFLVPASSTSSVPLAHLSPAATGIATLNLLDAENMAHAYAGVISADRQMQIDSLVLSVVNIGNVGSQVGDTIRSIIFGVVGFMVAISLASVLYTAVVMPKQVEGFENMLKETSPEKYQELVAKLEEGETFMSRPDLVEELVEVGTSEIAAAGDKELKLVLERVQREKEETGSIDMEKVEDDVKKLVGMTVEEYTKAEAGFEKNEFLQKVPVFSKFMSETDKELCTLLREERPSDAP